MLWFKHRVFEECKPVCKTSDTRLSVERRLHRNVQARVHSQTQTGKGMGKSEFLYIHVLSGLRVSHWSQGHQSALATSSGALRSLLSCVGAESVSNIEPQLSLQASPWLLNGEKGRELRLSRRDRHFQLSQHRTFALLGTKYVLQEGRKITLMHYFARTHTQVQTHTHKHTITQVLMHAHRHAHKPAQVCAHART